LCKKGGFAWEGKKAYLQIVKGKNPPNKKAAEAQTPCHEVPKKVAKELSEVGSA